MPRTSKAERQFMAAVSAIQFHPTPEQRDAKSAFWLAINDNPIIDLAAINLAGVVSLTGQTKLNKWWQLDGFKEWFTNKDEFQVKLESATHLAVDILMEIMQNPDANPAARVNAAKLVIEAAGKNASRSQGTEELADKKIQKMSEKQLEAYILNKSKLVSPPKETE